MVRPSRHSARMEKYVISPVMRRLVRFFPRAYATLETTGRRTGRIRRTPVGNGLSGDTFWLVSEHGIHGDYVRNLVAEPRVRVRIGSRWQPGSACLVPDDPDPMRRRKAIDKDNGLIGRFDGVMFRLNATEPATIRVDLDPHES